MRVRDFRLFCFISLCMVLCFGAFSFHAKASMLTEGTAADEPKETRQGVNRSITLGKVPLHLSLDEGTYNIFVRGCVADGPISLNRADMTAEEMEAEMASLNHAELLLFNAQDTYRNAEHMMVLRIDAADYDTILDMKQDESVWNAYLEDMAEEVHYSIPYLVIKEEDYVACWTILNGCSVMTYEYKDESADQAFPVTDLLLRQIGEEYGMLFQDESSAIETTPDDSGIIDQDGMYAGTGTDEAVAVSPDEEKGTEDKKELIEEDGMILFGRYEQDGDLTNGSEPIAWTVLDRSDDMTLLISKYGLEARPYNDTVDVDISWSKSGLREWLNRDFLQTAFDEGELQWIETVPVSTAETDGGKDESYDQVFLLSLDEVKQYFGVSGYDDRSDDLMLPITPYAKSRGAIAVSQDVVDTYDYDPNRAGCGWWWLRSIGYGGYCAEIVLSDGSVSSGTDVDTDIVSVRPVLWIKNVS